MAGARDWPDGLKDDEAVQRLQAIMIDACNGRRDLSVDRQYKRLRTPLIKRPDLADVVPKFIRAQQDLTSFGSYIRRVTADREQQREHVWKAFQPLVDRVEGRTRPPFASAQWTGRRTRTAVQQAGIVLSLAPDALLGVDQLLAEQEKRFDNGGPIEPEEAEAIAKLRALRDALSELIDLAETGRPLGSRLAQVRSLKNVALRWSTDPYGLALSTVPLLGMSTVLGVGVMYLVNAISPGDGAEIGAAVLGAHTAGAAIRAGLAQRGTSRATGEKRSGD